MMAPLLVTAIPAGRAPLPVFARPTLLAPVAPWAAPLIAPVTLAIATLIFVPLMSLALTGSGFAAGVSRWFGTSTCLWALAVTPPMPMTVPAPLALMRSAVVTMTTAWAPHVDHGDIGCRRSRLVRHAGSGIGFGRRRSGGRAGEGNGCGQRGHRRIGLRSRAVVTSRLAATFHRGTRVGLGCALAHLQRHLLGRCGPGGLREVGLARILGSALAG